MRDPNSIAAYIIVLQMTAAYGVMRHPDDNC